MKEMSTTNPIPLQDIKSQNYSLRNELTLAFERVLDSGVYVSSSEVENFENEFAKFVGTKYAIGVSNGTSALRISLLALGIKPGDKVVIPAMTFVATAEAVTSIGAIPQLVDVSEVTFNLDPDLLESHLSSGEIKCVVVVHLHGRLADMKNILTICEKFEVPVIEDAAQAHGASRDELRAGQYGKLASFSFYPGKNLGALGESGAICTDDVSLAEKCRLYRNWGSKKKYLHEFPGTNDRMDELQAAFLNVKLKKLDDWNSSRAKVAQHYSILFKDSGVIAPPLEYGAHVYHVFSIKIQNRDKILQDLHSAKIMAAIHYPLPIHLQPAYSNLCNVKTQLSVSESLGKSFLSLPIWESMTIDQINIVANNLISLNNHYND